MYRSPPVLRRHPARYHLPIPRCVQSSHSGDVARGRHDRRRGPHDRRPEWTPVQRVAACAASGEAHVAAAARTAVGRRSLHDLAAHPRRPYAVARDGDEARQGTPRAPGGPGAHAVPGGPPAGADEPGRARRVRAPRRRDARRGRRPPHHGDVPLRADPPAAGSRRPCDACRRDGTSPATVPRRVEQRQRSRHRRRAARSRRAARASRSPPSRRAAAASSAGSRASRSPPSRRRAAGPSSAGARAAGEPSAAFDARRRSPSGPPRVRTGRPRRTRRRLPRHRAPAARLPRRSRRRTGRRTL